MPAHYWVKHAQTEKRHVLAIQTLPNWTMVATFLAATAIVLSQGLLSLAPTTQVT